MKRSKKFLRRLARKKTTKALKSRSRFKSFTTLQNKYFRRRYPKYKRSRSETSIYNSIPSVEKIYLPEVFSINDDPNAVISLVSMIKRRVEKTRFKTFEFDFAKVKVVDDGAATILLSVCTDIHIRKFNVRVNLPTEERALKFMTESGFIKYFNFKTSDPANPNVTIRKGKARILQKESAAIIHKAMTTVYGTDGRNTRLQGLMIELMTNSVNHAYINKVKSKNNRRYWRERTWFISSNHYKDEKKVEFCFVDNGDGIINTISFKFAQKYLSFNDSLLRRAFEGEFRSRTKLKNRGKGLVVVRDSHNKMTVKGLKVITNGVLLDFETGIATTLKTPFQGTFYSWILDQSCKQP